MLNRTFICCCLLSTALLLGTSVTWIARGGPTFATSLTIPPGPPSVEATAFIPGHAYQLQIQSGFDVVDPASTTSTLPEIEFDLPSSVGDCLLIVGCLQGDLLHNDFEISLVDQSAAPPVIGVTWTAFHEHADKNGTQEPAHKIQHRMPVPARLTRTYRQEGDVDPATPPETRIFHLYTGGDRDYHAASSYASCQTRLLAESEHLRVWLDALDWSPRDTSMEDRAMRLLEIFETVVVHDLMPWIGEVDDIDQDGKFGIVLSSRLAELGTPESPLVGLTWSGDYRRDLPAPFGNHADLIYLYPAITDLPLLTEVIVHEYVHALSFQLRQYAGADTISPRNEDDWLNEGLAHVVETQLTGTRHNIQDRLRLFDSNPEQYPLVVTDYVHSGLWRSPGCRGATFSFLTWCRQNSAEEIVVPLLHSRAAGLPNLERVCGRSFFDLFRGWSIDRAKNSPLLDSLYPGESRVWKQASTSSRAFHLRPRGNKSRRVRIKNESESGIQLTLIPLSDPKAEEASLY